MGPTFQKHLNLKIIVIMIMAIGVVAFLYLRQQNENYYDLLIVSGATPLAVAEKVPETFSLTVNGLVKKEYVFGFGAEWLCHNPYQDP
jgi:hypothetical protein